MSIKHKIGLCKKCPPGSKEVPLIAGLCKNHYWEHRRDVNSKKPAAQAKKVAKTVVGAFFASQSLVMPRCCEECGDPLPKSPEWMRRACIAHIFRKRADFGFPSVDIHPMNKMFLCIDCHANFDNLGDIFITKMRMLPIIKERVAILLPLLTAKELARVPVYLLPAA